MCTYLKNMEGWKPKSLKNRSFANIQELFDKAMRSVNTFVDYKTEMVEESSKKAEAKIAHESNDGDDVTIDATPLSTKKERKAISKLSEQMMFNDVKLQVDYEFEMAFELLRLGRIVGVKSLLEVTVAKMVAAQNINNSTLRKILQSEKITGPNFTNWLRNLRISLRSENKLVHLEHPLIPLPIPVASQVAREAYDALFDAQDEVACLMICSISPDLQRALENYKAYDMIQERKTMFEEEAKQELFETVKAFHACKLEDVELHAMLKLHEKGIPKKAEIPVVLAIREGKIQKYKKKPQGAKAKDKGKTKLAYAPKPMILPLPKRENPAKDSVCHHCKEVGHWRRNCPSYHAELKKRMNASGASTSGIFTIELYDFPNKSWVYDTGCRTHICNTSHGLRESRKLKHGALSLYVGNGIRASVEAIESFDLILPSGLMIVLDICHFVRTITRGVVSISYLVDSGYIQTFMNYGISVLKYDVFYFNAISLNGIYEIDMHNLYPNVSSIYNVSNKRAKHALDSTYLWHCHLGHINKKRMEMLQRNGILQPTHNESLEKCKSCISGKMARKPFSHQVFQNEVENQLGKKIKANQSDRGGKYLSHEFVNHMKSYGIVSQLTPPYTPQHNRVSQRRNQTLLDMVQSMMILITLPKSFWGYALESVTRILNMVPTKKVDRTLYEIWHDIRAIRVLLAITADYDYKIWQMDVKTAFLNGYLSEDHLEAGTRDLMWKSRRLVSLKNPDEPCVYLKYSRSNVALLILYVDDILIIGNNVAMLQDVKS
ncbi:retrotransposon protein, putative, ty1-copia subclass [Tanacetum coccineum]